MRKNTENTENKATENKETKVLTFGEKLLLCNSYFENLRLSAEIAKKIDALSKLDKKKELSKEDLERVDKLSKEKKILQNIQKEYKEKFGNPLYSEVEIDKFALICAWAINPQKGQAYKKDDMQYYDISFNGMYKVTAQLKGYYKNYLDKPDSETKTQARKELVETLDNFVNQYMPCEKSETKLLPCEDSKVKLTFAKYDKDTTTLTEKEYKLPKNCMQDGYKPMKVHFVDTDEKPMIKNLITFCNGKLKWGKDGITSSKIDDYAIIQQVFLMALKYNLNFDSNTTTVYAGHII